MKKTCTEGAKKIAGRRKMVPLAIWSQQSGVGQEKKGKYTGGLFFTVYQPLTRAASAWGSLTVMRFREDVTHPDFSQELIMRLTVYMEAPI